MGAQRGAVIRHSDNLTRRAVAALLCCAGALLLAPAAPALAAECVGTGVPAAIVQYCDPIVPVDDDGAAGGGGGGTEARVGLPGTTVRALERSGLDGRTLLRVARRPATPRAARPLAPRPELGEERPATPATPRIPAAGASAGGPTLGVVLPLALGALTLALVSVAVQRRRR